MFGLDRGWGQWTAVDDRKVISLVVTIRVRGGKSQSHFNESDKLAVFSGYLDTKTLGGAGFASQKTTILNEGKQPVDFGEYSGIEISVIPRNNVRKYSLNLQSSLANDQRSYKWSFEPQESIVYRIKWSDFEKNYRGRPDAEAPDMSPSELVSLSIMCQSFFGYQQEGPFELALECIKLFK